MRDYELKRGFGKALEGDGLRKVAADVFGDATVDGGRNSCRSAEASHTARQSHARSSKSRLKPSENSSIASITPRSHSPQLWAPRAMPPAVGWLFTWALRSLVRSSTSTTDQSQGGRYSPRRNRRSTIGRLCTFTGLKEMVSLYVSASWPERTASSIASPSVSNGGFTTKYVFTVAPTSRAIPPAPPFSPTPPTLKREGTPLKSTYRPQS